MDGPEVMTLNLEQLSLLYYYLSIFVMLLATILILHQEMVTFSWDEVS